VKLLADENVSHRIVERLRTDGHTIILAQDVAAGREDTDVLSVAQSLAAVVLTEDTDFGDLIWRQHQPSAGVILLRLSGMARAAQPEYVATAITAHASGIPGSFTVIAPTVVRIRPLP
jgi:predicted nuclease of predicted toxin-antitoxin system